MIWRRSQLARAGSSPGKLLCCYLGEQQRTQDPTHMFAIPLGEIVSLRTSLREVGDPMIGCAFEHVGITVEIADVIDGDCFMELV